MPRALAMLAAASFALTGAGAQQVLAEASLTRGPILATKSGLTLPAGEFTAADLVEATARFLCRNYLYDDGAIAALPSFTLQKSLSLDALGAEDVLYALLASRDLVVLPIDEGRGLYAIVPLAAGDRPVPVTSIPTRTPNEILQRPHLRELATTTLELRSLDAMQLAAALQVHFALLSPRAAGRPAACAAGPRTLLLHGFRDQLAEVVTLVRQMERQAEATVVPASLLQRLDALEREVTALRAELQAMRAAGGR